MRMWTRAKLQAWPWAGFVLGAMGLILTHQGGSDSNHDYCLGSGAGTVLTLAVLGLLLAGSGAFLSWQLWRRGEHHETAARRFIALVSTMAAGVFSFAILMPVIAALVIPRCFG